MPNSPPKRYYWDANVFLSFISGEAARLPHLEALLDSADDGDIELYTSELSVVEVAFAAHEKATGGLDPATERAIDALWDHPSPVRRIDVSALITREARTLVRVALATPGQGIKPPDAIHLATAKRLGVDALQTYEDAAARTRWATLSGLAVEEPIAAQPKMITSRSSIVPGLPSGHAPTVPPGSSSPP